MEEGFKKVEKIQSKDALLPIVEEKERAILSAGKVVEVKRKPPKYHTEKTLLRVMETCGKSIGDKDEEESEEMMMSILSSFSIGTQVTELIAAPHQLTWEELSAQDASLASGRVLEAIN